MVVMALSGCSNGTGSSHDGGTTTPSCQLWDCPQGQICAGGSCQTAPACEAVDDWPACQVQVGRLDSSLGDRAYCDDRQCKVACVLDAHCGPGKVCTDFGLCRDSPAITAPKPDGARHALKAGYGAELLNVPIGSPLGGYGARFDGSTSRYGGGLQASAGQMDGMEARAVYLDNGEHPLIIIRLPIIFLDMSIHEGVARMLEAQTGKDWRDQLIISATHSHSGPARLWPLPTQTVIPLGLLGAGDFSYTFYKDVMESAGKAALKAIAQPVDAKFGWTIVENFDRDDQVSHDRREETPPFDDNRILLLRVDDMAGIPLAVLFSFGMHGTDNSTRYMTGDANGGAEFGLEDMLGRTYGRHVPAMFLSQNSGTMAPSGRMGFEVPRQFERIGAEVVNRVWTRFQAIETKSDVTLASRATRFATTYDLVGFQPGEWTNTNDPPFGGDYRYGAIQCFGSYEPMTDEDFDPLNQLNCFGLHTLTYNRPPTPLTRSMITTLNLDGLSAVTMPGELSMELSWQLLHMLQVNHAVDPTKAWTFGYMNDHQLYLLPNTLHLPMPPFEGITAPKAPDQYPAHTFGFLRGGYESSLAPWGPRHGDHLTAMTDVAWTRMKDPTFTAPNTTALPLFYTDPVDTPFPVDLSAPARVGTVTTQMPAQVKRLTPVEFAWVGGDPGAEMPQSPEVVLEKEDGATFVPVLMPSRAPYDNRGNRFLTRVHKSAEDWVWAVYWEEIQDFPTGNYRFTVNGHYQESAGAAGRKPYTVHSSTFAVVPSDAIVVSDLAATTAPFRSVRGVIGYPQGAPLVVRETSDDLGHVTGSFRMRNFQAGTTPAPLDLSSDIENSGVTVTLTQGATSSPLTGVTVSFGVVSGNPGGNYIITQFDGDVPMAFAAGAATVDVTVTDLHGNTGAFTGQVMLP